jgi:hypothetical protein
MIREQKRDGRRKERNECVRDAQYFVNDNGAADIINSIHIIHSYILYCTVLYCTVQLLTIMVYTFKRDSSKVQ